MLMSITRSFKSASTSSLLVISNLLPIKFKILELSACQFISYDKNQFSPPSINTIESVFAGCGLGASVDKRKKFFSFEFPPWVYLKPTFQAVSPGDQDHQFLAPHDKNMSILTSAIKTEKGVGIAIVSCSAGAIIHSHQAKLPDFITTEQAHTQALDLALHYADSKRSFYNTCFINSISKNALIRATSESKPTSTERSNRILLLKNPGYMELRHIENIGAKGITMSNQKAKMAIKQLATASPNGFLQSPSHLRRVILSKLKENWNEEWTHSEQNKTTRDFFPTIKDAAVLKNAYIHHQVTQVLTGHSKLNSHMHKINKISSPMCNCKEEEETVEHFIYRCPNHALLRKKLIKIYKQINIDFHTTRNYGTSWSTL